MQLRHSYSLVLSFLRVLFGGGSVNHATAAPLAFGEARQYGVLSVRRRW